jgi:hypothetical protein
MSRQTERPYDYIQTSSKDYSKPKFLRALPHAGELCPCQKCDGIRAENGDARAIINWPRDYPPKFYATVDWSEYEYE